MCNQIKKYQNNIHGSPLQNNGCLLFQSFHTQTTTCIKGFSVLDFNDVYKKSTYNYYGLDT